MGGKQRKPFELPESQAIERGADAMGEAAMFVMLGGLVVVIYQQEVDEAEQQEEQTNKQIRDLEQASHHVLFCPCKLISKISIDFFQVPGCRRRLVSGWDSRQL